MASAAAFSTEFAPTLAPPPAPRPLEWRRVWKLLRTLGADAEQTGAVFELFEAVGGDGGERTFRRFYDTLEGREILRERSELVAHMADEQRLAALPAGSLGRAYLDFRSANGFAADGLVELNAVTVRQSGEGLDPVRDWFFDRFTAMHDLWHVVTGCDTSEDGEALLLAFSLGQTPQRGFAFLVGLVVAKTNVNLSFQSKVARAWWMGRRARPLVIARWEDLLARPLDEVRAEFGVRPLMA
jgi:ubiquinone biosynthesis protein COQ4